MPFAHVTYFQLADTSKELIEKFMDICVKYLSGYPGQVYFSVGPRALDINRDVSATNFDISLQMIFSSFADYDGYSKDPRHDNFVTQSAGMVITRIVYDSFPKHTIIA